MTGAHANAAHTGRGKTTTPDDARSLMYIARQKHHVRAVCGDGSVFKMWCYYVDKRADVKVIKTGEAHRGTGHRFALVVEDTDFWLGGYVSRDFALDAARKLGCRPSTRVL